MCAAVPSALCPHNNAYSLAQHLECVYCRYEDYLDSQINATDIYYLEDVELARHLVELG